MFDRQLWRYFDWPLMIVVLILCLAGVGMVYSSTFNTIDISDYGMRQFQFMMVGLVALFIMAIFDYRHLEIFAPPAFLIFVASLVAVELFGDTQDTGSQRWVSVGGTLIQPTEGGKFLLIVFMAWFLSRYRDYMDRLPMLIVTLVLLLAPLVLIYLQPDLGMTVTFAFIGGTLMLVSGVQFWHLLLMAGGGVAALPFLLGTLRGYMLERIQVFLDPAGNADAAFNVDQSLIAVGSGSWMGRGWLHGSQNQLHFLRVRHSDFIFSVIGEELGLVGSVILLLLLFFVIWRLLRIADMAQDHFGRLIAFGVAALIFFQVAINVGMNLSLMPVTGLTLPFISYGGSSLLSMLFAIGLAQSVAMRHKRMEFLS